MKALGITLKVTPPIRRFLSCGVGRVAAIGRTTAVLRFFEELDPDEISLALGTVASCKGAQWGHQNL